MVAAAAAAALIGAGGCGGSSSTTSSEPTASKPTQPPTTATEPAAPQVDKQADQRVADRSRLRLSDLPAGWTQSDQDSAGKAATCDSVKQVKGTTTARSESPQFDEEQSSYAASFTYLLADEAAAHNAYAALSSMDTRVCMGEKLGEGLKSLPEAKSAGPGKSAEIEVGTPTTAQLSAEPLGDERSAARITVPLKAEGLDINGYFDLTFTRTGRGVSMLYTASVLSPFSAGLRGRLHAKLTSRLEALLHAEAAVGG